jgi:hypothetical protein
MSKWEKFRYTENKKERDDKKYDINEYYNRPIKLRYEMPNLKNKIDIKMFNYFKEEHKEHLDYMYDIVSSINSEIEREFFYKWSYLKTNLDYSIKEIFKYNKK